MIPYPATRAYLALPFLLAAATIAGQAQLTSVSPSLSPNISDPLNAESSVTGFNTTFDPSTSNLSNPSVRADINDPTHAQLLGSTLSPLDNSYINPQAQTTPQTGIVSDSRSIVGYNEFSFGGRRNRSFLAGGASQVSEAIASRQNSAVTLGTQAMQGAFAGASGSRAAFSDHTSLSVGTARSFSGEGQDASRPQLGLGAQALQDGGGSLEDGTTFYATDPVLTGSDTGAEGGPEIHGDLPAPQAQAAAFFADARATDFTYQYDDGQTPALRRAPVPGVIAVGLPDYHAASNGFPDSTKGFAGAVELQSLKTPFDSSGLGGDTGSSPFAPISNGFTFSPKTQLNPDLHSLALPGVRNNFETFNRNPQENGFRPGIPMNQASTDFRQNLQNYGRSQPHRSSKINLDDRNAERGGQHRELMRRPIIR